MSEAAMISGYVEKSAMESRPVIDALAANDDVIQRLHHQVARLVERLAPITQPEEPRDTLGAVASMERPKSEVTHRIEAQGRSIDEATERICHVLALLDL